MKAIFNKSYFTDSYIVFILTMESVFKQEWKHSELTAQNRQKERNKTEHFMNKKNRTRLNTLRTKRMEQERTL